LYRRILDAQGIGQVTTVGVIAFAEERRAGLDKIADVIELIVLGVT